MYGITVNISCPANTGSTKDDNDSSLWTSIYAAIPGGVVLIAIITLVILVKKRKVRQVSKKREYFIIERAENRSSNMGMNTLHINNTFSQKASSNKGEGNTPDIPSASTATGQMPQKGPTSAATNLGSTSTAENMRPYSSAASNKYESDKVKTGANFAARLVSAETRDNRDPVARTMGRNFVTTRILPKSETATLPASSLLAKVSRNSTVAVISHEFAEACLKRFKEKSANERDPEKESKNVYKGNATSQAEKEADLDIYHEVNDTVRDSVVEKDNQKDNYSITYIDPEGVCKGYREEFGSEWSNLEDDYSHANGPIRRVPSNLETYSTMQSNGTNVK